MVEGGELEMVQDFANLGSKVSIVMVRPLLKLVVIS